MCREKKKSTETVTKIAVSAPVLGQLAPGNRLGCKRQSSRKRGKHRDPASCTAPAARKNTTMSDEGARVPNNNLSYVQRFRRKSEQHAETFVIFVRVSGEGI